MCNNCIHKPVCSKYIATGGVNSCEHHKEERKGRWELHGNDDDCGCSYFCSNCHKSYDEDYFYVHGQYIPYNYCPHCGFPMEC